MERFEVASQAIRTAGEALRRCHLEAEEIRQTARRIYRALDCKGFARVDLFLTPAGDIVFNEVNTIPGFTAHSRYPSMMRGIGIGFSELITRMIRTEVTEG